MATESTPESADASLTPRQREVLDLLARGYTNGQLAEALGISLDGAKWHVSEVITKLGVDTREEAAEHWRRERGIARRLRDFPRRMSARAALGW
jgi:DNA-binding CsgD family transcriptional regulator